MTLNGAVNPDPEVSGLFREEGTESASNVLMPP